MPSEFLQAASRGDIDKLTTLLGEGADLNEVDDCGWTALHWASLRGYTAIVEFLLSRGIQVDKVGNYDQTPLHLASSSGRTETVAVLLSNGAQIDKTDEFGRKPLHLASMSGHIKTVEFLLSNGSKMGEVDNSGQTPLHLATSSGRTETVAVLLSNGAQIDKVNNFDKTALHEAVNFAVEDCVKVLCLVHKILDVAIPDNIKDNDLVQRGVASSQAIYEHIMGSVSEVPIYDALRHWMDKKGDIEKLNFADLEALSAVFKTNFNDDKELTPEVKDCLSVISSDRITKFLNSRSLVGQCVRVVITEPDESLEHHSAQTLDRISVTLLTSVSEAQRAME